MAGMLGGQIEPRRGPHEGLLRLHRHAKPGRDTAALRLGQRAGLDEIDYDVILAGFELAIVLEAGYARVVSGEADNPIMLAYGQVVLDTMAAAAELASTTPLGR